MQMQLPQQMGAHGFQTQFPVVNMGAQFGGFNPLAQLSGAGLPAGLAPGSMPPQGINKQKQPSELNYGNAGIPESTQQKDQGVTVIFRFSSSVPFISLDAYDSF